MPDIMSGDAGPRHLMVWSNDLDDIEIYILAWFKRKPGLVLVGLTVRRADNNVSAAEIAEQIKRYFAAYDARDRAVRYRGNGFSDGHIPAPTGFRAETPPGVPDELVFFAKWY